MQLNILEEFMKKFTSLMLSVATSLSIAGPILSSGAIVCASSDFEKITSVKHLNKIKYGVPLKLQKGSDRIWDFDHPENMPKWNENGPKEGGNAWGEKIVFFEDGHGEILDYVGTGKYFTYNINKNNFKIRHGESGPFSEFTIEFIDDGIKLTSEGKTIIYKY